MLIGSILYLGSWVVTPARRLLTEGSRLSVAIPVFSLRSEWSWLRWRLVVGNSLMSTLRLTPKPRILIEDFWLRPCAEVFSLDWGLHPEYSLIIQFQTHQSLDHDRHWSWPLQRCQNRSFYTLPKGFILFREVFILLYRFSILLSSNVWKT